MRTPVCCLIIINTLIGRIGRIKYASYNITSQYSQIEIIIKTNTRVNCIASRTLKILEIAQIM